MYSFRLNSILFEFQNIQNFGSNVDWNKLLFGNMIAFGYFESFRKSQTHWRCLIEEKKKLYSYEITVTITAIVYNIWKLSSSHVSGNTDVLASILWRPIDNPLKRKYPDDWDNASKSDFMNYLLDWSFQTEWRYGVLYVVMICTISVSHQ